jgi:hypothetical protein
MEIAATAPQLRNVILESALAEIHNVRPISGPADFVNRVGWMANWLRESDRDVEAQLVPMGMEALRDLWRTSEPSARPIFVGSGSIAARVAATDRASILENVRAYNSEGSGWRSSEKQRVEFYRELNVAVLKLDDDERRNGVFAELRDEPLRLPPGAGRDWYDTDADPARVAAIPADLLRAIWTRSLHELDMQRSAVCRWLAHYAPVVRAMVDISTVQRIASDVMDLGDWWP